MRRMSARTETAGVLCYNQAGGGAQPRPDGPCTTKEIAVEKLYTITLEYCVP